MRIVGGPMDDTCNRERDHCYHLKKARPFGQRGACISLFRVKGGTCVEYEYSRRCRSAFSDPGKGENAKRDEEQDGEQAGRDGHGVNLGT